MRKRVFYFPCHAKKKYLSMSMNNKHTYEFPRPALSVDCVVFGIDEGDLKLMLIKRKLAPFKNKWALPGGFVRMDETTDHAARRELEEESGLKNIYLEQLYTFSKIDRDPRQRVVSICHYALVRLKNYEVHASTDASDAAWFSIDDLPSLAFDHQHMVDLALDRLKGKLRYKPIGFELLPELFTLSQLQHVYEVILGKNFDKRNFRRRVLKTGLIVESGEVQKDVAHRAAQLFKFDKERYKTLENEGFNFEI